MRFRQKTKDAALGQSVKRRGPIFAAGLLTATIMACAPVIDNRGYFFDDRSVDNIEKGVTNKEAVRETFGSPSRLFATSLAKWIPLPTVTKSMSEGRSLFRIKSRTNPPTT